MKPNWISLQWLQMYASHSSTCEAHLDTYQSSYVEMSPCSRLLTAKIY